MLSCRKSDSENLLNHRLPTVPDAQWKGLPVLLLLGAASLACALLVGFLVLALARRSSRGWAPRPTIATACRQLEHLQQKV